MVRFQTVLVAIILLLLFTLSPTQAQHPEYQVKSVLLGQIANQYIDWPEESEIDNLDKPFVIGLFGSDPFTTFLRQVYSSKQKPKMIKNKTVVMRHINRTDQITGCHLLYVSGLPTRRLSKVIEFTRDKPILTVADTEDYAMKGIHINFVVEKPANIGLVINETGVRQAGLLPTEDLLNTATKIVNPYRPYKEKALQLIPITSFITWPPISKLDDPSTPFKITVIGSNDFGSYLDTIFKKQTLKKRPVIIRYIKKIQDIKDTNILFISKSMKNSISEILSYTKGKPILTIGDTKGFHQAGVHINFFYDRVSLCFEINEKAARKAGLRLYYHLLKMAKTNTSD